MTDRSSLESLGNDPRLKMFLRQAGVIIAMERGLSKASREKLHSLAIRLELTEDEFRQAIEQLQDSAELPQSLDRWERAFVGFLNREIFAFRGGVLPISFENRAIDLAAQKYQISEMRAHQLLQKVATDQGVSRIAEEDAERFGRRLILESLGSRSAIETEQREEFYRLGDRWGLSRDLVQQLVEQALIDNSKSVDWPLRSGRLLVGGVGLFVVLGGCLVWASAWWQGGVERPSRNDLDQPRVSQAVPPKVQWWNDELEEAFNSITHQSFPTAGENLTAVDPAHRLVDLKRLIELTQNEPLGDRFPGGDQIRLNQLVALIYFYDPNQSVSDAVLQSIQISLSAISAPSVTQISQRQIDSALWAVEQLEALVGVDRAGGAVRFSERAERLSDQVKQLVGTLPVESSSSEFFREARRRLASDLWDQVTARISRSGEQSADVIPFLKDRTERVLGPEKLGTLELRAVLAVLNHDQGQWEMIRDSIASVIQVSSLDQTVEWIDRLPSIRDSELFDYLAVELMRRCEIQSASLERTDVRNSLVQYRNAFRQKQYAVVIDYDHRCDVVARQIVAAVDANRDASPRVIAETVYAVNLSLAFIAELDQQPEFSLLNELLLKGLPQLNEIQSVREGARSGEVMQGLASPAENRMRERLIERLTTADGERLAARTTALESLGKLAGKFPDLPYPDALRLADYLLEGKDLQETLVVERILPQLSIWPNLHLALADRVRQSRGNSDDVMELYQLLTRGQEAIVTEPQWREVVSIRLVEFALSVLQSRDYLGTDKTGLDWQRLQIYYDRAMTTRTKLVNQMLTPKAWDYCQYSEAVTRWSRQRVNLEKQLWFDNASVMATDASGMVERVVTNQLLIELLGLEIEDVGSAMTDQRDSIFEVYRQRMREDISLGDRLLLTEYCLLQMVSLVRQQRTLHLME